VLQIENSESLTLHLVLPPTANNNSHPTPTTSSNSSSRGSPTAQPQHRNGSPGSGLHRPGSQTTAQAMQGATAQNPIPPASLHAGQPAAEPQGQPDPHIQQTFAQFQAVNQQLAAQLAAIHNNPFFQAAPVQQAHGQHIYLPANPFQAQGQPILPQMLVQQPYQPHLPQQQHFGLPNGQQVGGQGSQQHIHAFVQNANPTQFPTPGNTNTVVREHVGPNGQRWQTVTHTGHVNINAFHNPHNMAQGGGASVIPRSNSPRLGTPASQTSQTVPNAANAAGRDTQPSPAPQNHHSPPSNAFANSQATLSGIEAAIAAGQTVTDSTMDSARHFINSAGPYTQDQRAQLWTRFSNVDRQRRHSHNDRILRAARERAASQREARGADSSAVYVLSSPQGPQALLVSPSGFFTTPWHLPSVLAPFNPNLPVSLISPQPGIVAQGESHTQSAVSDNQQPQQNDMQLAQTQAQEQRANDAVNAAGRQAQEQQANQARDLVRILLPLGGHLWLLIRLFGFVYFFTHGASWQRTILLGLIALLVFVGQTGVFHPLIQGIWDPIRRHADNLIPLAANGPPRDGNADARRGNAGTTGAQGGNREPTPQEAAERLLRERERQDGNLLRQGLRRVERAVALFVASLVPGVGERHIAAREAAEAARQAETREREERVRREEEEEEARQQQIENGPEAAHGATDHSADTAGGSGGGSGTQAPAPTTPLPLVEV